MTYYDKVAPGYNELHKDEQLAKVRIVLKEINLSRDTILDVGCGTALYSYLFRFYTGIDSSQGMLDQANAKVVFGEAENLPFEDKSFDIVISVTAIHNFKDPKKAIQEMKRVARKKVIITLLKKAKNFEEILNELKDFRQIDQEKDLVLIKG